MASKKDWDALKRDVKPIYTATAPNHTAAKAALEDLDKKWGKKYAAITRLWTSAWEESNPTLDYDVEIRKVICSTKPHRVPQRPLPPRSPRKRALPDRAGSVEVPVSSHS